MTAIYSFFQQKPSWKNLSLLVIVAVIVRAAVFFFYIQHSERYHQADSNDYHVCAYLLTFYNQFTKPDGEPIFWRTPGYPAMLVPFYSCAEQKDPTFSNYTATHKAILWTQLIMCSFIPLILFFLALLLTASYFIAWLVAWISVIHVGFVLSALYLLTDGPASLFFYLFLWCYYQTWNVIGYPQRPKKWYLPLVGAALFLSAYTWMRPMGVFVALFSALLLLISNDRFVNTFKKIALFLIVFFTTLTPWYLRNYNLTGKLFFCPMSGGIMQAFCAPKVIRRVHGLPLETCTRTLYAQVIKRSEHEESLLKAQGKPLVVSKHLVCGEVAWPWIVQHPFMFAYDWIVQACKTAFDLYASQLVAFTNNTYTYDPIEEFLSYKVADCLYAAPIPWWMRIISWLEFLCYILVWIGIFAGSWLCCQQMYQSWQHKATLSAYANTWIKLILMSGAIIIMTGGFGYARLRLPIEPLMLIAALMFWTYNIRKK